MQIFSRTGTLPTFFLASLLLLSAFSGQAQYPLYVSEQGSYSKYEGEFNHTTADRESGNASFSPSGPIQYSVEPEFSIGPSESKTWKGTIYPDPGQAPAPGSQTSANLEVNAEITYSRPAGSGSLGVVLGTHQCGGCSYHGGEPGDHETVKEHESGSLSFEVYSIKLQIEGKKDNICPGDTVTYKAVPYPTDVGVITWSDGQTGESVDIVVDKNMEISATLDVQGAKYEDIISVTVAGVSQWEVAHSLSGSLWEKELKNAKGFADGLKKVVKAIPGNITVSGPNLGFSYKKRDCCHNGDVKEGGEQSVSGTLSAGISANDIPLASPPWTASFKFEKQKYGYVFSLEGQYGLFLSTGVQLQGELGCNINECTNESCLTGSVGIDVPLQLAAKVGGSICLKRANAPAVQCKGVNKDGSRCKRRTSNSCGYCSSANNGAPLHTTQSWWCFSCPSFQITPASLNTSLFGGVSYNADGCSSGLEGRLGIGPVNFTASVSVLAYEFSWSYEVWKGGWIYP